MTRVVAGLQSRSEEVPSRLRTLARKSNDSIVIRLKADTCHPSNLSFRAQRGICRGRSRDSFSCAAEQRPYVAVEKAMLCVNTRTERAAARRFRAKRGMTNGDIRQGRRDPPVYPRD